MSKLVERARQTSSALARGLGFVVFEDKRFGEIIDDYFGQQHELDMVVDWSALAATTAHLTPDSKVNVNLSRGTLEDVLSEVLDDLSRGASDEDDILCFYVLDGRVKVSTHGEFAKLIVTRIYNISHLARGTPYFFDAPELGLNRRIPSDLEEPPPYLNLPAQAGRSRNPRRNFDELRAAYRFIFFGAGRLNDRAREAGERWPDMKEVGEVVAFILADAKRPICMPSRKREADGAQTQCD
ncbi:MAG: hypothetical protein IID54_07310 [Proteobacteria bacterium]|nr:hypothetical protein [Pseudomonadota bacterium]